MKPSLASETEEAVWMLSSTPDSAMREYASTEKKLHFVVDQETVFTKTDRNKLWEVLELYGVQEQLLDNTRTININSHSAVRAQAVSHTHCK